MNQIAELYIEAISSCSGKYLYVLRDTGSLHGFVFFEAVPLQSMLEAPTCTIYRADDTCPSRVSSYRSCHWRHILVMTRHEIKSYTINLFFAPLNLLTLLKFCALGQMVLIGVPHLGTWSLLQLRQNWFRWRSGDRAVATDFWRFGQLLRLKNFDQHILYRSLEVVEVFWFNGRPWCMQRRMSLSSMKRTPHRWKAFADAWQKVSTSRHSTCQLMSTMQTKGKEESETWHF